MDVRRGEVGQRNAVRINNSDVIVISSNDIILRSERGSKKAHKFRSSLKYTPKVKIMIPNETGIIANSILCSSM